MLLDAIITNNFSFPPSGEDFYLKTFWEGVDMFEDLWYN